MARHCLPASVKVIRHQVEKSRCLWRNNDWLKISVSARIYIWEKKTDRQTETDRETERQREAERGAISWSVLGPVHVVGTSSQWHRPCNIQTYLKTKLINNTFCWCTSTTGNAQKEPVSPFCLSRSHILTKMPGGDSPIELTWSVQQSAKKQWQQQKPIKQQ